VSCRAKVHCGWCERYGIVLGLLMAGKTQREAGRMVGKSRGYVIRAERGAVSRGCMTPLDRSHVTPAMISPLGVAARQAASCETAELLAEIRAWVAKCHDDVRQSREVRQKLAASRESE
jgi:hypothetical protein